jgi:predicted patatin/cPLA2 family phospholipase
MNIYKKKLINNSLRLNSIANYFIELTDKNDFIELHKFIKNKNLIKNILIVSKGLLPFLKD